MHINLRFPYTNLKLVKKKGSAPVKKKFVSIATAAAVALSPIATVPSAAAADPAAVLSQTTGSSAATDFTTAAKQAPAVTPLAKAESTDLSSKVGGFVAFVIFLGFMLWSIGWNSPYNPNGRFAEAYK